MDWHKVLLQWLMLNPFNHLTERESPSLAAVIPSSFVRTLKPSLRRRTSQFCQRETHGPRLSFLSCVAELPANEHVDKEALFGEALTLLEADSGFSVLAPEKIPPYVYEAILSVSNQGMITRCRARRAFQTIGGLLGIDKKFWLICSLIRPMERPLEVARILYGTDRLEAFLSDNAQSMVDFIATDSSARILGAQAMTHLGGHSAVLQDGLGDVWQRLSCESNLGLRAFLQEEVVQKIEHWPHPHRQAKRSDERVLLADLELHLTTARRAYEQFAALQGPLTETLYGDAWPKATPAFVARQYLAASSATHPFSFAQRFLQRAFTYPDFEDAGLAFAVYARYQHDSPLGLSRRLKALLDPSQTRTFETLHALRMIYEAPLQSAVATGQDEVEAALRRGGIEEYYRRVTAAKSWQPQHALHPERLTPEVVDALLYGVSSTLLPIRRAMPALKPFQAHRAAWALCALPAQAHGLLRSRFMALGSRLPEQRMLLLKELAARADAFFDPKITEERKLQELHKVMHFADKLRTMSPEQAARMTTILPISPRGMSDVFKGGWQQQYTTSCGPTAILIAAACYQPSLALGFHEDPCGFAEAQRQVMKQQGVRFRPLDVKGEGFYSRRRMAAQENIDHLFQAQVDPLLRGLVESGVLPPEQHEQIIGWRGYRGLRRRCTDGSMQDMTQSEIDWSKLFVDLQKYSTSQSSPLDPLIKDADALMNLIAMATPPESARGTHTRDYAHALLSRPSGCRYSKSITLRAGDLQGEGSALLHRAAEQAALYGIVLFSLSYAKGRGHHAMLLVNAYPIRERDGTYERDAQGRKRYSFVIADPGTGQATSISAEAFAGNRVALTLGHADAHVCQIILPNPRSRPTSAGTDVALSQMGRQSSGANRTKAFSR